MSKSRVNPRRKPVSMADVQKAAEDGRVEGAEFGAIALLWALVDKCGADHDYIHQVNEALQYIIDSIVKGYVCYEDMRQCLKEEYHVEVNFK